MATFNTASGSALTANFFVSGVHTVYYYSNIQPQIQFISQAGNNQTFNDPNILTFTNNTYADVYINGVLQPSQDYVIIGDTLTINTPLQLGDRVTIGATGTGGGAGGNIGNANITNANISNANIGNANINVLNANVANIVNLIANTIQANTGNFVNLNVTGNSNLGNVNNVHIFGGSNGQVLTTDGNGNLSWTNSGTGTVTNINTTQFDPSGLGFTLTGGPITSTGTVRLNVPSSTVFRNNLNLGNVSNANFNGNGNTYLAGNGSWLPITGGGTPGGLNSQLQFNNNGNFAGSNITYDITTGNLDMDNKNIIDLRDPVNPQDAATKYYVDLIAQGISNIIDPVRVVSDTNLSGVYNNGASGVGATLSLSSALTTLDGITLNIGDRILVKGQTNQVENGIYTYDGSTLLTRATDSDTPVELDSGSFVFCESGTTYNKSGFILTSTVNTIGTDNIVFQQFSGAGSYTAGTGLSLTGTQFNLTNTGVTSGTYGNTTHYPSYTVDNQGRLTFSSNIALPTYGNVANLNLDGNVSNVLHGDGTWSPGGGLPAGNTTEIQFNSGGSFAASNLFTWNNNRLIVKGNSSSQFSRYNSFLPTLPSIVAVRGRGTTDSPLPANVNDECSISYNFTISNDSNTIPTFGGFVGFRLDDPSGSGQYSDVTFIVRAGEKSSNTGPIVAQMSTSKVSIGNGATAANANTIVLGTSSYNVEIPGNELVNGYVQANTYLNSPLTYTNGIRGLNYGFETAGGSWTSGTNNLNILDVSLTYPIANNTANQTLNIRGNATTTLNSIMQVAQALTVTYIVQNGATAYGVSSLQIDGITQTIRWAGGITPSPIVNTRLAYTFVIFKTSSAPLYQVLGSMTRFG